LIQISHIELGEPMSEIPMSIEEARAVMWVRPTRRPLGELLDEGFLTRERLEWAAENAYDVRLKRAAAVLLEHIAHEAPATRTELEIAPPALDAGISIQEARSVVWPFSTHKGKPMGELVDSRQLSLKDLGYAVENAWDEHVRRAAAVLAAARINQAVREPPPPAGPLNVISGGRSYARRRESDLNLVQGGLLGVLAAACVLSFVSAIRESMQGRTGLSLLKVLSNPIGVVVLVLMAAVAVGGLWATWKLSDKAFGRLQKEIENYQRSQEGEARVVEILARYLDGQWSLFRNVVLPGRRRGDLDLVLVGPPGVFALEVKCYSGAYRNVGARWEVRTKDGRPAARAPASKPIGMPVSSGAFSRPTASTNGLTRSWCGQSPAAPCRWKTLWWRYGAWRESAKRWATPGPDRRWI
jgi:hypothetical protein